MDDISDVLMEKLRDILHDILGTPESKIQWFTKFTELTQDSLEIAEIDTEIALFIEKRYGFALPEDWMEQNENVGQAVDYVKGFVLERL